MRETQGFLAFLVANNKKTTQVSLINNFKIKHHEQSNRIRYCKSKGIG